MKFFSSASSISSQNYGIRYFCVVIAVPRSWFLNLRGVEQSTQRKCPSVRHRNARYVVEAKALGRNLGSSGREAVKSGPFNEAVGE
jgi:hypothetical protein